MEEDSLMPAKEQKKIQKPPFVKKQQPKPKQVPGAQEQPAQQETQLIGTAELEELRQELENFKNQFHQQPQSPQQQKSSVPWGNKTKPQNQQQPKTNQPKPVNSTIEIIQRLQDNKAFVTTAQKYGTALAASILAKSAAEPGKRVNFEDEARKTIEIKGGSYALVYASNNKPLRLSPYVWSFDQQTRRLWGVFTFNNFYGHKNPSPLKIWKNMSTAIVVIPIDHSSDMVDDYGKGHLMKVDEVNQMQMPIAMKDSKDIEKVRAMIKNMLSSALTLFMDLSQYTKPKINLKMILIVVLIAAAAIVAYYVFKTHPNLLSNLLPHA